jgi:4-hydroxy-tetrahydrodipicolinate synthase
VATLTPFHVDGTLAEETAQAHAAWLVAQGVAGLCPAGTTGEFLYLTEAEKRRVLAATLRGADGRVPVIAGVWALTARESADLARAAESLGADGVFLPPPIYYPATDDAIFAHYAAVREATNLPVFAYNIPQYAANEVSIACLQRLFAQGVLTGVKDSTGKSDRVGALVSHFGAEGIVFAASDSFASEGRRLGADGFISAIANVTPTLFVQIWNGEESLQPIADRLRASLKQFGSIPALKHLLGREGFAFGSARLPFSDLTPQQKAQLDALDWHSR